MHRELLVAVIGTVLSLVVSRVTPIQEGNLAHRMMMLHTDAPALNENPNKMTHLLIPREICAGGEIVSCYSEPNAE